MKLDLPIILLLYIKKCYSRTNLHIILHSTTQHAYNS